VKLTSELSELITQLPATYPGTATVDSFLTGYLLVRGTELAPDEADPIRFARALLC